MWPDLDIEMIVKQTKIYLNTYNIYNVPDNVIYDYVNVYCNLLSDSYMEYRKMNRELDFMRHLQYGDTVFGTKIIQKNVQNKVEFYIDDMGELRHVATYENVVFDILYAIDSCLMGTQKRLHIIKFD